MSTPEVTLLPLVLDGFLAPPLKAVSANWNTTSWLESSFSVLS